MTSTCPPDHKHAATLTCFARHGCTCQPCTDGERAYRRRLNRLGPDGQRVGGRIPIGPAHHHLHKALAMGIRQADIARASGIDPETLRRIYRQRTGTMWKRTADAILAVDLDQLTPFWVEGWRGRRRIEALEAQGYSLNRIINLTGVAPVTIYQIKSGESAIERPTFDRLDTIFRQHGLTRPVGDTPKENGWITKTRRRALAAGYAPAAAWDDIDNPHEQPKGAAA